MDRQLQSEMYSWALTTFGTTAAHTLERACRCLEETTELAQAAGLSEDTARLIITRVYERPADSIGREMGQAAMTLAIFAAQQGVDLTELCNLAFIRAHQMDHNVLREKHRAKVLAGTALPVVLGE